MNDSFLDELDVASLKLALPRDLDSISSNLRELYRKIANHPKRPDLVLAVEEVAIHQFKAIIDCSKTDGLRRVDFGPLSIELARYGLFSFTDTVLNVAPHLLRSTAALVVRLRKHGPLLGCGEKSFAVDITHRLLNTGIDPNANPPLFDLELREIDRGLKRKSPWRSLIEVLQLDEVLSPRYGSRLSGSPTEAGCDISHEREAKSSAEALYSDYYIQHIIKLYIEYGADLQPQDVHMLTSCLPSMSVCGFDWPGFLNSYSQPAKRLELEDERRERIRRWPMAWWSRSDERLLGLRPESSEDDY